MAKSTTTSYSSSSSSEQSHSESKNHSRTQSESVTRGFLDQALLESILGGLTGYMSDAQIEEYAKNLLAPQLAAGLEAAQQGYETTKLAKEQEIENLARSLEGSIAAQHSAYARNIADVENAALRRGMGRSSYTLQTLAGQGDALAAAVRGLTEENAQKSSQLQQQISQAAQHSEQTKARLNTDYASQLAAKIEELRRQQRQEYNQHYMTAVSGAMGQQTTGSQNTHGSQTTDSNSRTSGSSTSVSVTRSSKR